MNWKSRKQEASLKSQSGKITVNLLCIPVKNFRFDVIELEINKVLKGKYKEEGQRLLKQLDAFTTVNYRALLHVLVCFDCYCVTYSKLTFIMDKRRNCVSL